MYTRVNTRVPFDLSICFAIYPSDYLSICLSICICRLYIYTHVYIHTYILHMPLVISTCREAPAGPSRAIRAGNVVDVYGAFDDCSSARDSFNVRSDQRFGCRGVGV